MLPQSNATLSAVANKVPTEAWRASEVAANTAVWSGAVPAYYQEKRQRMEGTAQDLMVLRSLIVEEGRPAVAFEPEQVVTFDRGSGNEDGEIQHVERRTLAGMGPVQTTRLTLKAA